MNTSPEPAPDPGAPTLLVVVAHPDDEAFGCGSVIAHATAHGFRTTVACATRGELGEPAPGSGLTRRDLPEVRERELRDACRLLGAERVELLGYLDSGVEGPPAPGSLAAADPLGVRDRVAALLDEEITHLVDVEDHLDVRWRAIRTHASQVPPFAAMDPALQRGFLGVDRLLQVDPPWHGGPQRRTWIPNTHLTTDREAIA